METTIDRILGAKTFERNPYLTLAAGSPGQESAVNGEYDLRIVKAGYNQTSNTLGEMIWVEFEVIQTNSERHPIGAHRGWVTSLVKPENLSSAKSFFYAAMGADDDDKRKRVDLALPKVLADFMANKPSVLIGLELHCSVTSYLTKKTQKFIELSKFSPKR